jgi:hypothetical protein
MVMAAKRCPMCRMIQRASAERCDCGYRFGQSATHVRSLLVEQRRRAWANLAAGAVLASSGVGAGLALHAAFLWVGGGGIGMVIRGLGAIRRASQSLREVDEQHRLPAARIVTR